MRKLFSTILSSIFIVCLAILATDRILGIVMSEGYRHTGLIFPSRSQVSYKSTEFSFTATINKLGFRDRELTKFRVRLSKYIDGELGNTSSSEKLADTYDRRGLESFRTNLRLLKGAAATFGAKLFVAKQATLIVPDLPEEERRRVRYDYHGFGYEAHVDAFRQIYRIIDEEIAAENIIDVTPISGTPKYFYDHIHPTELGAQKIAEIVATALVPYISELDAKSIENAVSRSEAPWK